MTNPAQTSGQYSDLPNFHVLIAAAGTGQRMGTETPKQYIKIHGKSVLRYSIETFLSLPECASLRVIINPNDADLYHDAIMGLDLPPSIGGGKERSDSIINGLNSLDNLKNEDIILIHDGARPLTSPENIRSLLESLKNNRAATLAAPISATLRRSDNQNSAIEQVSRDNLWSIQTPQAFRYEDLLKAHKNADPEKSYTDDTALVSAIGIPVKLVEGSEENIKVTRPQDLEMAEKLLKPKTITRSGLGFDVHAFDADKPGPVRLCGVNIDHPHALKGHSDADVGLHAITDALLGAISEGDIGQHFPPSNDKFKDMDSAIFLEKSLEIATSKNAHINNIDLTLICEEPKIGPHAHAMRKRIAEILNLQENQINVKATTTEQLGFTGRKEGIAAQALVTITTPEQ